jgi:NAD(P)-dependent dehydrogenase (short-subunit alcohol dehydrogenase family)
MTRLAGRCALITGASTGIGAAAAARFAREGARVLIAGLDEAAGERVADRIGAEFLRTDVTVPAQVEAAVAHAVERFGRLDILYGNAGCNEEATAPDTRLEAWDRILAVNLSGQFYLAKYGIPALQAAGGGAIILTASELGLVGARANAAYCAAKGGVVNLTRALAVDCAPLGIRVNCICPGPTRTPMMDAWLHETGDPEERERMQVEPIPLRRMASPDEIAATALFLAGPESSFTTGAIHVADGGATITYGL